MVFGGFGKEKWQNAPPTPPKMCMRPPNMLLEVNTSFVWIRKPHWASLCQNLYICVYIFGVTYAYIWQIETCYGVCQPKIDPLQVLQLQTLLSMACVCALWSGGIG